MPKRTKLFLAAVLVIPLAISWTERASNAAEKCIAKPNAAPPRGSHWYYSVERSTRQKCWYLGPEGARVRASAPRAAAARLPSPKPVTRPAENKPGAAAIAEPAASNAKTVKDDSIAARFTHSSTPPTESIAWGPAPTTTSSTEMKSGALSTGDEPTDSMAARFIHSSPPPTKSVAREPASMTTAYAEEETGTPSRNDEQLVWPITPAELAVSTRQPETIITFVNLLVAFFAALGLVFMIVHMPCGPSIVRKLGQSIIGRRPGLAPNRSSSGTHFSNAAATQAEPSRKPIERKRLTSNDPDAHIEASVQRLLQELKRRRHEDQPQDFEWTTRKITA